METRLIHTKTVIDMASGVIVSDNAYEYTGPMALANLGSGALGKLGGTGLGAMASYFGGGSSSSGMDPSSAYSVLPDQANILSQLPAASPSGSSGSSGGSIFDALGSKQAGVGGQVGGMIGDALQSKPMPAAPEAPAPSKKALQQVGPMSTDALLATLPPELRNSFLQTYGLG